MNRAPLLALADACRAVPGEFWECGVHRGKTAVRLRDLLHTDRRTLRLFDTFCGRPPKGPEDTGASKTLFADTSETTVRACLPESFIAWHVGLIPETFVGLEDARIAFAFLDLDLYGPTREALAFVLPRVQPGAAVVVHDYQQPLWPGVTTAVRDVAPDAALMADHFAVVRR